MLIDDDKHVVGPLRGNIEHYFQRQGVRLFHCDNAKEGLELAKSDRTIKLVLLDVMMPCTASDPLGTIPLIPKFPCAVAIYSAHTDEALIKAASDNGSVAYISKLDRADEQLERIDDLLKSIIAAKVRRITEENEGYRMRAHWWDRKLATAVAVITLISFSGGVLAAVMSFGATRQAEKDGYVADRKVTTDKILSLEARLVVQEANAKTLHRIERNVDKLLLKAGIPPTRDGE